MKAKGDFPGACREDPPPYCTAGRGAVTRLSGAGRAVAVLVTILSPEGKGELEAVSCFP